MILNITIQKNAAVSIHQQLITQIALQIASGSIPPGSKLPSLRGLSKKLGIHYNTCLSAYKELAELGLIETRQGSGATVKHYQQAFKASLIESQELQQVAQYFVKLVSQRGFSWNEVEAALKQARSQQEVATVKIIYVDAHKDILPVFQSELEEYLSRPIRTVELTRVSANMANENTYFIVNRYHYKTLKEKLGNTAHITVIDVSPVKAELEKIKRLPPGALICIISCSTTILEMAEALISGLNKNEIFISSVLYKDNKLDIENAFRHAKHIVCDSLCAQEIRKWNKKPFSTLRLIDYSEIEKIKTQLSI